MITKTRTTKETDITISLDLKGTGKSTIDTGVGFLDHMLESFSKHSLIDLDIKCVGDTHIDDHHSVEDIGIVLGALVAEALYPIKEMERFGSANIVMDEACVSCDLDLSNRPFLVYEVAVAGKVGQFDTELVEEFFRAFVLNSRIKRTCYRSFVEKTSTISLKLLSNLLQWLFVAQLQKNERVGVPSTKGTL